MKFPSCGLFKLNISCAILQPTLRKNIIKELKSFNRREIFQPVLTNETVQLKLSHNIPTAFSLLGGPWSPHKKKKSWVIAG